MKKSNLAKRGPQDAQQPPSQPDKTGWIRKFCGKGIFREIWKNRFVVLKGDQLYISEKEVKDEKRVQEVVDLSDYERSEELRRSKSRSKRNHSKFTLLRSRQPGNPQVPNLVFLAVSPEEKESWISVLNVAITRAKNHALDQVRPSSSLTPSISRALDQVQPSSSLTPSISRALDQVRPSSSLTPSIPRTLDQVQPSSSLTPSISRALDQVQPSSSLTPSISRALDQVQPSSSLTPSISRALDQSFSPSLSVSPPLQVTVERESPLSHPTRDRPKIPHARRLPTRGHLLAVVRVT
ncbi:pleckstrin homology domain-containing family O member 1-A isoform X2 [Conger conger]|uniref:pleckstrin homology domain-containing family O member 1-A isoform X2 n=1 Tax=Conger conger TaxID=82655 RepID=UPI002A5AE2E0|nr:pleckstrin homology domain-containing family O member 1-A isoform X2 [Conger conger]